MKNAPLDLPWGRPLRWLALGALFLLYGCIKAPSPEQQLKDLEAATGLERIADDLLGKTHRGYPVVVRMEMGEVYGRFATRVVMGEVGKELGGVWEIMTGQYHRSGTVVGSTLDRMISEAIGYPLSVTAVLEHGKHRMSRLDIRSNAAPIRPPDPVPYRSRIGFFVGSISSDDPDFAARLSSKEELLDRISAFRSFYIRVDSFAVSFFFAGTELEYSQMIRTFGGSHEFLNAVLDSLASIADLGEETHAVTSAKRR